MLVAAHNGIPPTTARRIVDAGHVELLPRGGARTSNVNVFKAKIKADIALSREELVMARPRGAIAAARMEILERTAERPIGCMDLCLVNRMALHCQHAVAAAERMEEMQYGT
ncbi:hypothetical protein PC118_g8018 [Phytophthora cactorum]|uniref:Uncharacterized protein n=1 Tax=Phytophthora cactorum TaxID=29920 RepID=A0A8T0ZCG8_9STRA|nr:hypothetical protein PC111_g7346 [Phytophthora cactorum]KAG2859638.1 hypothetical protein PC113_g8726 [Phytophthora cactorum]KAG2911871.1 hypothetical protein PC114_g9162 [Phytophthora cactorum]KAG2944776.1 hypothetical protein PC117_g8905 [Phytophthora cactorum]KAG2985971.1 hypothetical protein PC118_g8018 [Phytophthora cactorum]